LLYAAERVDSGRILFWVVTSAVSKIESVPYLRRNIGVVFRTSS
jgi:ABC-type ATPase involved in cell division